jgi:hypothetical protein
MTSLETHGCSTAPIATHPHTNGTAMTREHACAHTVSYSVLCSARMHQTSAPLWADGS